MIPRVLSEVCTEHIRLKLGLYYSSVGIATDYGIDDRGAAVRVQTGSEAHPTFYPMGTGGSFPGGKAAGT
jgi:hypothetical protein